MRLAYAKKIIRAIEATYEAKTTHGCAQEQSKTIGILDENAHFNGSSKLRLGGYLDGYDYIHVHLHIGAYT